MRRPMSRSSPRARHGPRWTSRRTLLTVATLVSPSASPAAGGHERTRMKRLFAFATLLGALSLTAALVSGSASAVGTAAPSIPGHVGGVVPTIGGPQVQGSGNLIYHGGPTMTTNKAYSIFWVPAGYSIAPGYDTTINQYFGDVAHDSGMSTNVYAVATQGGFK